MLTPDHLRVLLDETRLKILESVESATWEDFRGSLGIAALKDTVAARTGLSQRLASFVCESNNIRCQGNLAAHSASKDDIREAIMQQDFGNERELLGGLFRFVYGEEL